MSVPNESREVQNQAQAARDILLASMAPKTQQVPETPETEDLEGAAPDTEGSESADDVAEGLEQDPSEQEAEGAEAGEGGAEGETPLESIENLEQLANAIGADLSDLYHLKVPIANGEPITLGELKDKIQAGELPAGQAEKLQQERSQFEAERQAHFARVEEILQSAHQTSEQLIDAKAMVTAIAHQYQNTDWRALEAEDPGTAALRKQELQMAFQQAQAQVQDLQGQADTAMKQSVMARRAREEQAMSQRVPDWGIPEKRQKLIGDMSQVLISYGYRPEEIGNIMDHRALHMVHDLLKAQGTLKSADATGKMIRKLPSAMKPSGRAPAPSAEKKLQQQLKAAAKTGDQRTKVDAVAQLLRSKGVKQRV